MAGCSPVRVSPDADDEIVHDGESVRVPVLLMDDVQRAVATKGLRLHDGAGNPAGQQRGYVFGGNAEQRQRAADAYDERTRRLQNAWRSPAAAAERNEAQLEAWRRPGARPGLRQDGAMDRATAHAAYVQRIQNAWRAT
jgi:hypothetical protein